MGEAYAGEQPQYHGDLTIEQAEANAPTGCTVIIESGGMLTGCKGIVLGYEMKKGGGSWRAEATVQLTEVTHSMLAFAPPQKIAAGKLRRAESTESTNG